MFLETIRDALWGFPFIALLLVSGVYFTVRTGFFQLHPLAICRHTLGGLFRKKDGKKQLLASVATALGGTVGVGSITGIAYGITVGGAGSIFWMWISGLTGMALKYTEVYLAVKHRRRNPDGTYTGGAPYALSEAGHGGLGILFACLCVCASFGVGNLAQIGSVAQAAASVGISAPVCGLLCAALLAFALGGGRKRIGEWNTVLVPLASFVYLGALCFLLLTHLSAVPAAFLRIFREAFGIRQACGGITGAMLALSIREGFARGVFSNEAGVGSSPLAHAASGESDPQKQGEWGAFEILCDTFLVSTLTALALLATGQDSVTGLFDAWLGTGGRVLFALLMAVFAFASILSWCYYSEVCLAFLNFPFGTALYRLLSVAAAGLGAFISLDALWAAADILNAFMILPNLFLLFLQRKEVFYQRERLSTCGILKKKKPFCAHSAHSRRV